MRKRKAALLPVLWSLLALVLALLPADHIYAQGCAQGQEQCGTGDGGEGGGGCPPLCGCNPAPPGYYLVYSCGCVDGQVQNRTCTYYPS
jgi:hypothetical protein